MFCKYLNFCSDFFGRAGKQLDKKAKVFHLAEILMKIGNKPNISRSKDNQTMKFGHLIEYNRRNNLLKKSYKKCCG